MSTNFQAQVKVHPQQQTNCATADSLASRPGSDKEPIAIPVASAKFRRTHSLVDCNVPETGAARSPSIGAAHSARGTANVQSGLVYAFSKRTIDLVLGTMSLIIATPIILIAAAAIRLNTPGSPFFFQTRIGRNGKPFKIFKLRGMFIDARTRFPGYYDYSGKHDLEFCFHHEEDPRVTRAGRFIRKTSIDELPNLWNVVLGDVSLVGPRPEIPEVLALYGSYRDEYLSVKPGITCFSKVTGRDRLTKRETIEFDLDYIRRRSFSVDMKILWRTFRGVILRRDVF
jgi:lipopolysaccharide/colanic/teichoic acid biosynthesis glycosyltransferase